MLPASWNAWFCAAINRLSEKLSSKRVSSPDCADRLSSTASCASARISQMYGGGMLSRRGRVSEISNRYCTCSCPSARRCTMPMPDESRAILRSVRLFQNGRPAQAVASGRWLKIMTCEGKSYLYSLAAVSRNCIQLSGDSRKRRTVCSICSLSWSGVNFAISIFLSASFALAAY